MNSKFDSFLNYSSLFVILAIVVTLMIIAITVIFSGEVNEKKISIHLLNSKDSLITNKSFDLSTVDTDTLIYYLNEIHKGMNSLNSLRDEIIGLKNEETYNEKLYISLLAIVLAIAGFFGFKSVYEIKNRTITTAKSEATETAKEETRKILTKDYLQSIINETTKKSLKLYDNDITNAFKKINKLENTILEMKAKLNLADLNTEFEEKTKNVIRSEDLKEEEEIENLKEDSDPFPESKEEQ